MRLVHISDFHYTHLTLNPLRLFSKRLLGTLNWFFFRRKHFFERQLDPLPALFKELKVDQVLFGGDFSTTSLIEEFKKAKRLIAKSTAPWIAVPGNHDCYTFRSCKQKNFYRYFANEKPIKEPIDFFNLKEHRVEAHDLGKNWVLVALDTAVATNPYSSEGFFSEKLENYLKEVLALIPKNKQVILLNHFPFFQNDVKRHNLIRGEALQKVLEQNPQVRLYLHGHTHRHTIADLQVSNLPIVLDSGSSAEGKKGSFNLIDLKDDGCTISTYRWNNQWTKIHEQTLPWTRRGLKMD